MKIELCGVIYEFIMKMLFYLLLYQKYGFEVIGTYENFSQLWMLIL